MSKGKWLGVGVLALSAPMWLSAYWAMVTGEGLLPPASDGIEFLRVFAGLYGPALGLMSIAWSD